MNPQIQEILNKSTDDIMGVPIVDQERFARLLIEECATICFELRFTTEGPAEGASYQRTLCGHDLMSKDKYTYWDQYTQDTPT